MREVVEQDTTGALGRVLDRARGGRIAVLCVEREHTRCHRDVIIGMITELDPTIEVFKIL